MGLFGRFFERMSQTDEERLSEEVRDWAQSVPGTTRIGACPRREQVRLAGIVRRLTIRPAEGNMEAEVWDGSGQVSAMWTGRSHIPGLGLGTQVVLEGVISHDLSRAKIVNPRYEFA